MHDHSRPSLNQIDDPVVGSTTNFWDADGIQWSISPHFDRWFVSRHIDRRIIPLVTLHRTDDGWRAVEVNGYDEWSGETVQEVLRRLL